MKIQVLVSTINQTDHSLVKKMNITTDAIIGNQCNHNSIEEFKNGHNKVLYLNFNEKGVGLNRNNSLMRANGDICLFADDDMTFVDDYKTIVTNCFEKLPKADVIIFNLIEKEPKRYINKRVKRINRFNYLRYGTARITIKLDSIRANGIYFNQCFGGGTSHCHGEDNLFLNDCLKKGLKIYAVPYAIATLTENRKSTWLNDYNEKYLQDQGILYKTISKRYWKLLCLQDAIRKRKRYNISIINAYNRMTHNTYDKNEKN